MIQEDGKYETVPTLRGVRALAAADLEGDGRAELLFGDGWHKAYAKHGRFRPTVARWQPGGAWTSELVEERSDQYSIERIGWFAGHLVASGSQGVYRYRRDGGAWKRSGPLAPTASTGSWSSLGADALLLSGPAARRVPVSQP